MRKCLLLGVTSLVLAGCFDARYDVNLNNDGSGRVAVDVVLDKEISQDMLKRNAKGMDFQPDGSQLGKSAQTERRVENGQIIVRQTLDFKTPAEINAREVNLTIDDLGRSILGVARSRIRLSTGKHPTGPKDINDRTVGDKIVTEMFKGHEIRVTMHLPCTVENARELMRDKSVFAPTVKKSWFGTSTVTWRMPLAEYLILQNRRERDVFEAICWSWAGIKPGRSTQ